MKTRSQHKTPSSPEHIVDVVFLLTLFLLFAISSLMMIIFGAQIYHRTVEDMSANFNRRTASSYITEKIRQGNQDGSLEITNFGDSNALCIYQIFDNQRYVTYLYQFDGYLIELFTAENSGISPGAGQKIVPCNDLTFQFVNDQLLSVTVSLPEEDPFTVYESLYQSTQGLYF